MAKSVTLSSVEIAQIGEKINENKMLKETLETQTTTIKSLTKENKELKKQIKKLEEENKAKEQDMKKKFMELHSNQKKVHSELEKYESVPEFKSILELHGELLQFRKETDNIFKNDLVHQERRKLDKKIEEYKQRNVELETELRKHGARISSKVRVNDLQAAESNLRKLKEQAQAKYLSNKTKVNEMTAKIKNSTAKLVGTITNALTEVTKHLEVYKTDLENIKKSSVFIEKPAYDAVMNILLEQQNALMKDMIQVTASANQASNSNVKDDQSNFDSDTDSPDEDDVESVHGDSKRYKIIMHNVNEEWADGLQDLQKIRAIIKTFTTLNVNEVDVERMGKVNPAKKRPLKVTLPTFQHVQVILKTKNKLQNTCYSDIKICSFKKKTPNNQYQQGKGNKFQ